MRRVAAKFVPKLLNCDQKQHRMNIANEMLDSVRDDPNLLQRIITGDEAWVYGYDVETKAQSSQWKLPHEPRPKKARQVRSNVKVLLTVFFDCRGVVHHEFLPQGRTVNKEYYLQVMRNLREAIRQKRPDLWKNKNWLLHHDNAPAHTSLLVRDFLAKNNTLMMPRSHRIPQIWPPFFIILFMIFIIMMVGGILGYIFRNEVDDRMHSEMLMTIPKYLNNNVITDAWDKVQSKFKCCGIAMDRTMMSYEVWKRKNIHFDNRKQIPRSCCQSRGEVGVVECQLSPRDDNAFMQDCYEVLKSFVKGHAMVVGGFGIGISCILVGHHHCLSSSRLSSLSCGCSQPCLSSPPTGPTSSKLN
ncbi:hypothetical protein LAZ67_8003864 [Cordylochernes scorpioides]|uniref:Mariner Mos1 transposase n=1 Tax=Cordylochernes scorpioides TaxID=51811 RepID=A0ABY6KTJ2_9ARAC|nr:hypothetical protein LAZ67_8003864 [Cordylochernes scorpioides]